MDIAIYVVLYIILAVAAAATIGTVLYFIGRWLGKNIKLIGICTIVVIIALAMVYFSMPARAEDLPEELKLYGDDLDEIWVWYEEYPAEDEEFFDYAFDQELSNFALHFIVDNQLEAELDRETRIIRGRIVVLTMWEATEDPFDDEVINVYFTEFVTH